MRVVYYSLYSLDTVLCLLVIPFAYFYYEEWDIDSTNFTRAKGAAKYSIAFLLIVVALFLVGFFVPAAASKGKHADLDFFRKLLLENHGERALTFMVGTLLCLGTIVFVVYTAPGIALYPISLIKKIPALSVGTPQEIETNIELNRERQRIILARYRGDERAIVTKERKEYDALKREEKTLRRKLSIALESQTDTWWGTLGKIIRPIKVAIGVLLLLLVALIWVSMLLTGIDKAKNSLCGAKCGYILAHLNILNPTNYIFVKASHLFPLDYILTLLLVLLFFLSTIVGITFLGIRFLWINIFSFSRARTKPQALLISTVLLSLSALATNYYLGMILFPDYATFGGQVYCAPPHTSPPGKISCKGRPEYLMQCTESSDSKVCTPTVMSTFLNRISINFPFFGAVAFWGTFAFLAVSLLIMTVGLFRTPKLEDGVEMDQDEEEEALLAGRD